MPEEATQEALVNEANSILSNGRKAEHEKKKSKKKPKAPTIESFDKAFESSPDRTSEKQLRLISIHPETLQVRVKFDEIMTYAPAEGEEESTTEVITREFKPKGKKNLRRPHKDLTGKLRKLVPHALAICEIEDANVKDYAVSALQIDGDSALHNSRVTMTVAKLVNRTGKYVTFKTGQVVMYGDSEYDDAPKMSKIIEEVEKEAFAHLAGKYEVETPNQIPLFT